MKAVIKAVRVDEAKEGRVIRISVNYYHEAGEPGISIFTRPDEEGGADIVHPFLCKCYSYASTTPKLTIRDDLISKYRNVKEAFINAEGMIDLIGFEYRED